MKSKITFLLTSLLMLLLGVGSSRAEVGDVVSDISQISATKCYTITTARGALVANLDGTQGVSSIRQGATNPNASTDADAAKWGFLLHDGSYYLYNVKTQTVYGQNGILAGYLNNGLELKALQSPDSENNRYFKFMQGTNTLNNNQTGVFVIDDWSTEDAGNKLAIIEAGEFTAPSLENLSTITFNYQNEDGITVDTETIENCIAGATINSTRTGLYGVTINTPSAVATGEDLVINTGYTLVEGYPLKFGTTLADAPKYLWRINRATYKYATANNEQQISNISGSPAFDANHAFCFVGSPLGFKIYSAGSESPYGPGASATEKLTQGDEEAAATFVFLKNESNGQNLLRDINNANGYLNDVNNKMGYWLTNLAYSDAGSSFSFIEYPSQFEVDGLRYVVKGEYSNEVYVTYNADAEPNAAGQNAYTGDIVVPATVTYEGAVFNVTEIGRKAFAHSTVTSVVIGDNVTTTGMDACANIPTLKSLTIGAGVTTVGQGICYSCPNLKEVTIKSSSAPTGADYMFTSNPTIRIKVSALQSFTKTDKWSSYANNYKAEADGFQFNRDEMLDVIAMYESYIAQNEGFFSDNVACYSNATKAALEAKIAEAKALAEDADIAATSAAVKAMVDTWVINPLVEGYYYVVSAGNGPGYYTGDDPGALFNDEYKYALYNGNGIVGWKAYNSVAADQMYYFTEDPANPGNWFLKNLGDNTYFNKGTAQYACNITTSTEPETSQIIEPSYAPGKVTMRYNGNLYVYSLTSSHNGQAGSNNEEGNLSIWGAAGEAAKYKMNVFYIRPVSEKNLEYAKKELAKGLEDLIAKIESEEIEGSNLPGDYSTDNVAALDAAIESAKGLTEASATERFDAFTNLKTAYNTATTELNPITEGYYYIVSKYAAYKNTFGAPAAMFTAPLDVRESGLSNVRFDTFDENNANYIFKVTPKDGVDGGFYVQNAYNDYYLNTGDGSSWYGEITTCTETAVNAQLFKNYGVGQFFIADETDNRVSRVVRTTGVKNGTIYGWTTISDNIADNVTGYNAWELIPVAADKVAELIAAQTETDNAAGEAYAALDAYVGEIQAIYDSYVENTELSEDIKTALTEAYNNYTAAKNTRNFDILATAEKYDAIKAALEEAMKAANYETNAAPNYYIVAEEPSTPEAGKTYIIKNAYNNYYLNDKGIANEYSRLNNAALWTIEATSETVDDAPVYTLKSEGLGGYWQYDDFAALSTAETGLLDGFDVHEYAGLNATMGDVTTAQGFTILPATEYASPATRTSVGQGQEAKGFVITSADPVEFNGASSLFKLDTQRNTNAALDPYTSGNVTLGWLFYEVTKGTVWEEEIALAKTEYALDTDNMPVGKNPGFYNSEKVSAYTSALEAVNALGDESTDIQIRRAIDALAEAYTTAIVPNPIVEGYYYVISAGKGTGYYSGNVAPDTQYDDEGKFALFNGNGNVGWKAYNSVAPEQMYYFSEDPANPGNWFLKNLGDNTYFNKGTAQYTCNVTTSTEAETSQIFENSYAPGKFTMRYNGNPYVYSLTPSHNGQVGSTGNSEALDGLINIWGTAGEAAKFKMNVFYIRPVSEANLEAAKEKLAEGLEDLIAKIESEEIEGSDLPGYYSTDNVAALDAAIETAKNMSEASADERLEALANLKTAYNTATTELNPITEGYYYIVSKYAAYKDNFGAPAAMFTAPLDVRESGLSNVRFDTFDENNANYIFKITPKDGVAGGFYVQNAYNDYYLNTGDGSSWYGEVTTCTETAVNAQLFNNYGLGQFFIADETDNRVSRCVRVSTGDAKIKNGTIYGWTTIADVITADRTGYNAWELIPVDADKVAALIAAQTETDNAVGEAYTTLNAYVEEIQATYDSYVESTELSEELKTALTNAYNDYTDAKNTRNFDILATAEKYDAIKAALEEAMKAAHDEVNGINGIAAGGNAAVTVGNGGITVTASEATTIKVVSAAGAVVAVKNLEAGETATISLLPGVYVVNGNKVMVK